ncbi:unnamed protein product [Nesidiocoris tenuis]|uniref:Uncharacterized protein n=1 Tax=Nesidiocoris tenuis TaxID=355587 RepID=A0A6H5GHV0_9HEMI|nr:unnamed protein product [Nesidiocoris tenuis]
MNYIRRADYSDSQSSRPLNCVFRFTPRANFRTNLTEIGQRVTPQFFLIKKSVLRVRPSRMQTTPAADSPLTGELLGVRVTEKE